MRCRKLTDIAYLRFSQRQGFDGFYTGNTWRDEIVEVVGGQDCTHSRENSSRTIHWYRLTKKPLGSYIDLLSSQSLLEVVQEFWSDDKYLQV